MKNYRSLFMTALLVLLNTLVYAAEYHVAKTGKDSNAGTEQAAFKTIYRAAEIALPGDTITVHQGTYRERIDPAHGGKNNRLRIVYRAAENEKVWIKGSEVITNWEKYKKNVWKVTLDNSLFGDFNPYQEIVEGDWLINTYGRDHHLGEVYINGDALYEIDSLEKVQAEQPLKRASDQEASKYQWVCESDDKTTTIYANFKGMNPNEELVEINVRPVVFYPRKTGVNYITVRGFNMCHAATQWAPPTAEQQGLIGPHWSKGWIIENNVITDSKCTGISIGKERGSGHNEWTHLKVKHGTQRERDVIFKALQMGWSMETIGSHIIRNNVIHDCGQAGICGHLGGIASEIYNNHIYNNHTKNQFFGYETGGIKLHAAIDVLIKNNCIHDNNRGIWLDWQAQGTRVSGNLIFNHPNEEDLFIEVNHGPMLIDNNILLSRIAILNASQGTAFVHNLIAGNLVMRAVPNRFTPYHFPHSTSVAGLMTILTGDDRFYNNILATDHEAADPETRWFMDHESSGLNGYNEHPLSSDYWYGGKSPDDFAAHKLPVFIASNLYYHEAEPFNREVGGVVKSSHHPNIRIEQEGEDFYLTMEIDDSFEKVNTQIVTSRLLGAAFESEADFENYDGTLLKVDQDCLGNVRNSDKPAPGPFESLKVGKNRIKVFHESE